MLSVNVAKTVTTCTTALISSKKQGSFETHVTCKGRRGVTSFKACHFSMSNLYASHTHLLSFAPLRKAAANYLPHKVNGLAGRHKLIHSQKQLNLTLISDKTLSTSASVHAIFTYLQDQASVHLLIRKHHKKLLVNSKHL